MRETRLHGEAVFSGAYLKVEVDRVRLDDGSEAVREVVRHPGAVVVVPLLEDGRVVMVAQHRYAVGRELVELPAGKLDPGEAPAACAARELAEETGFAAAELVPLLSYFAAPGFCDERMHVFVARGLTLAPAAADEDERIEVVIVPFEEAVARARAGQLPDGKTLIGLLLADPLLRRPVGG